MLEIRKFTKSYGEKKAVEGISLSIHSGDIYGFIGANGAGKMTTIKAVVGIHDFDGGEIMIGDCGVMNFFINREKLRNKDFSDVFYNWDCY